MELKKFKDLKPGDEFVYFDESTTNQLRPDSQLVVHRVVMVHKPGTTEMQKAVLVNKSFVKIINDDNRRNQENTVVLLNFG